MQGTCVIPAFAPDISEVVEGFWSLCILFLICPNYACRRKWQPTPMFLPAASQGQVSLVGCCLWGRTESDTTEVTQQPQCIIKMKIKGVIEDLKKFFNLKNDNNKNISRNFSGAVEGSVGSVQFLTVPCSSLYFSRSIGPFQCSRH